MTDKYLMDDHHARVRSMILDDGYKWDLSPNDKAALRHVLGLVNSLAGDLSDWMGEPIPMVLQSHSHRVKEQQAVAAAMRSESSEGK